jgi:hypothetical protein
LTQTKYSPRRIKGLGLTDGEGTERLWSFLRDFSRITKEMGPEKRVDVLTDGLLHYGYLLRKRFGMITNATLFDDVYFTFRQVARMGYGSIAHKATPLLYIDTYGSP